MVPGATPDFLDELRAAASRSGPAMSRDADANDAPRLLEVIRALELPLVLVFNEAA